MLTLQASNILDVPNFFWTDEPTLHPLYLAVREYLEIKPRIQVLNERCKVFLDLAEILSDAIADKKMTREFDTILSSFRKKSLHTKDITWIIIILIVISIFVTCSEVFLRFGLIHRGPPMSNPNIFGSDTQAINVTAPTTAPAIPHSASRGIARVGLVTSWILIGSTTLL